MIDKLFIALICLMPWGQLFFKQMDLLHAQGHLFQTGLLVIFCCSFFERPKNISKINIPLGAFVLWVGLITSYLWFTVFVQSQHYPVKIFLPFFNLLCFVWFYKLSIEYLDKEKIEKILLWFKYSILLMLFYCVLQYLHLDEFLKGHSGHDEMVGTIGNKSHLAGLLAIVQPLFFNRHLRDILVLSLLWLVIFLCNSASGLFVGFAVVLFWLLLKKRFVIFGIVSSTLATSIILLWHKLAVFFSSPERFAIWKLAYNTFKDKAITGFGLGSFGLIQFKLSSDDATWKALRDTIWRHLHNEYYQIAFEIGFVGLVLALWCIWDYFRVFKTVKTDLTIKLATMFTGFCLLSLFTFPGHLWQMAMIMMMSYSFIYTIGDNSYAYQT